MGNFRSSDDGDRRGGFGGRSSGSRFGGRSGGRGGFGGRDRRPVEMHDAVCGKCGKEGIVYG